MTVLLERTQSGPGSRGELRLTVSDNGRGMDSPTQKSRFGLSGMRERVEIAPVRAFRTARRVLVLHSRPVCRWQDKANEQWHRRARDGAAATAHPMFCGLGPQIVVMDITLPGISGIEAMKHMVAYRSDTRVLIFSMHEAAIFAKGALQAGAFGYVTKFSAPAVLVEAVLTIARGRKYLSGGIAQELALGHADMNNGASVGLSPREFEVLRMLVQGKSVRDIARSMQLNPKSIANHQSAIKQKLGAETRIQLLRKASSLGIEPQS